MGKDQRGGGILKRRDRRVTCMVGGCLSHTVKEKMKPNNTSKVGEIRGEKLQSVSRTLAHCDPNPHQNRSDPDGVHRGSRKPGAAKRTIASRLGGSS